jgi:hypothetical protein
MTINQNALGAALVAGAVAYIIVDKKAIPHAASGTEEPEPPKKEENSPPE